MKVRLRYYPGDVKLMLVVEAESDDDRAILTLLHEQGLACRGWTGTVNRSDSWDSVQFGAPRAPAETKPET